DFTLPRLRVANSESEPLSIGGERRVGVVGCLPNVAEAFPGAVKPRQRAQSADCVWPVRQNTIARETELRCYHPIASREEVDQRRSRTLNLSAFSVERLRHQASSLGEQQVSRQ